MASRGPPFMHKDRIAIIGIGCRFPGGVNDAESFWKLLLERRDAVSDVPADRWNVERYYDPEPGIAGKTFVKRAGFLDQIDKFDPAQVMAGNTDGTGGGNPIPSYYRKAEGTDEHPRTDRLL